MPPFELTRMERAFAGFAPRWVAKRALARAGLHKALQVMARAYEGADRGRLQQSWNPGFGSADADIFQDLPMLRQRSRDLIKNDGYAAGIVDTMVSNVIGTGIRPQSRIDGEILGLDETATEKIQRQAERGWRRWCDYADVTGRCDFYGLQALFYQQKLENGEGLALARMVDKPGRPYKLALEMVEADRLGNLPSRSNTLIPEGKNQIRGGVEIDADGMPVAYHIRRAHPGDGSIGAAKGEDFKFMRVPATDPMGRRLVMHSYAVRRPGQTRGVPILAPVLSLFKHMSDYIEAELVAARVGACMSLFIKKMPNAYDSAQSFASETLSTGQRLQNVEPGTIDYLGEGEEPVAFNPNRPGGSFEPFTTVLLRNIAAGTGQTYEQVARDFSKVNYSSARAALLESRRWYRKEQAEQGRVFCQPIWEALLEEMWLRGEFAEILSAAELFPARHDLTDARWIAPGWQWVDPEKEVNASMKAIAAGLSCHADECAAQGKDWEENFKQLAREQKTADVMDLELDLGGKAAGAPGQPAAFGEDPPAKEETA